MWITKRELNQLDRSIFKRTHAPTEEVYPGSRAQAEAEEHRRKYYAGETDEARKQVPALITNGQLALFRRRRHE